MNFIFSKSWGAIIAGILVIVFSVIAIRSMSPYLEAKKELQITKSQQAIAEQRIGALTANKDYYQSREYLERQARIRLNYKKPGEKVVYVYDRSSPSSSPASGPLAPEHKSWLEWIMEMLGI